MRVGPSVALIVAAAAVALVFSPMAIATAEPSATGFDGRAVPVDGPCGPDATAATGVDQVIRIDVRSNGDAVWRLTSRFPANTTNETAAFRQLADDVAAGDSQIGYSVETVREFVTLARPDREMTITDANWTSRVANDTGYLTLRFRWTGFATVGGDAIVLGDVLRTRDGDTWLPRLTDGQCLIVAGPEGYVAESFPPDREVVDGAIVWIGPYRFAPGEVQATYLPEPPDGESGGDPTTPTSTTDDIVSFPPGLVPLLGVLAVIVLGVLASVAVADRFSLGASAADGSEGEIDAHDVPEADGSLDETGEVDGSPDGTAAEVTDDPDGNDTDDDGGAVDEALLSDEERVERLLERNGGRMRQTNIVSETGWSNAKVSQLLSGMDEDDRIDKLRIGRENLIALPDEEIREIDADGGDTDG
ncbi:hypothetical protein BRD17_00875 [Halobacteriales archaeon SW_7_68_16]|nr:MAG: hypothetical protein BRD17_00875 [Halobacteriales archaeon SW_7_68_16]